MAFLPGSAPGTERPAHPINFPTGGREARLVPRGRSRSGPVRAPFVPAGVPARAEISPKRRRFRGRHRTARWIPERVQHVTNDRRAMESISGERKTIEMYALNELPSNHLSSLIKFSKRTCCRRLPSPPKKVDCLSSTATDKRRTKLTLLEKNTRAFEVAVKPASSHFFRV